MKYDYHYRISHALKTQTANKDFFIVNILLLMAIVAFESRLTDAQEIIIDLN